MAIIYGEPDVLRIDVGAERHTACLFWKVVAGIGSDHRPTWVSAPVSRSALPLIEALDRAATTVEVRRVDGAHMRMRPASVRRDAWVTSETTVTDEETAVSGRLEAVDLELRNFRIRDDVGNGIDLHEVADGEALALLVGRRTRATGSGVLGARGQLKSLKGAVVEPDPLPATWVPGQHSDLTDVLTAPGPDPDGVEGLTSQDVEELLAGLRG